MEYLLKVVDVSASKYGPNVIWSRFTSGHIVEKNILKWWRDNKWEEYQLPLEHMILRVVIELPPPTSISIHHTGYCDS